MFVSGGFSETSISVMSDVSIVMHISFLSMTIKMIMIELTVHKQAIVNKAVSGTLKIRINTAIQNSRIVANASLALFPH